MKEEKIIRKALKTVSRLGSVKKGNYLKEEEDGSISKHEVIVERVFEGFGFEIVFPLEDEGSVAIWFNGEPVYNNISGFKFEKYDYTPPLIKKLEEEEDFDEYYYSGSEIGDWEELLEYIADNSKKIKKVSERRKREREAFFKWFTALNECMLKHLKFKLVYRESGDYDAISFPDKEYKDYFIRVSGSGENKDALQVYSIKVLKTGFFFDKTEEHLVYDYATTFFENGDWLQHLTSLFPPGAIEEELQNLKKLPKKMVLAQKNVTVDEAFNQVLKYVQE